MEDKKLNQTKIAVVDIETTGFLKQGGLIVEVGIVELNLETGEIKELYNELVCESKFSDANKDSWIFSNSNLKFEEVKLAKPLNIEALQEIFNKYKATAFNKRFDFDFLSSRGLKIEELRCPMEILTDVCKIPGRYGKYKWPKVQEAWDILFKDKPYIEAHRGYDDAEHEAKLVYYIHKNNIHKY